MTKPVYVREDGSCGPTALKMIEDMSADHKSQASIAVALGVSKKKFKEMLEKEKGENPERLAWEAGHAVAEQQFIDHGRAASLGDVTMEPMFDENHKPIIDEATGEQKMEKVRVVSKAGAIQFIWFTKTQFGWTEKPTGATFQDNRINITLPAPTSREDYFKRLGIAGPLDFRKLKDVTPQSAPTLMIEGTKNERQP